MLNYYLINTYNSEVTEIKKDGYTQTLYIGKRENKAPFYCVYDKRLDKKGHMSAVKRFGTTEFLRHEWRLKRDYLRERKINTIDDLSVKILYTIGDWLAENKSISFISPKYTKKSATLPIKENHAQANQSRLHKQIKGIYRNHFTHKEYNESIKNIGEIQIIGKIFHAFFCCQQRPFSKSCKCSYKHTIYLLITICKTKFKSNS